jgi:hypothetical protein
MVPCGRTLSYSSTLARIPVVHPRCCYHLRHRLPARALIQLTPAFLFIVATCSRCRHHFPSRRESCSGKSYVNLFCAMLSLSDGRTVEQPTIQDVGDSILWHGLNSSLQPPYSVWASPIIRTLAQCATLRSKQHEDRCNERAGQREAVADDTGTPSAKRYAGDRQMLNRCWGGP